MYQYGLTISIAFAKREPATIKPSIFLEVGKVFPLIG